MGAFAVAALLALAPGARGATVSGTVTSTATSNPIAEVCVELQDPAQNPPPTLYWSAPTNTFGQYSIPDVGAGDYRVHFYHCPSAGSQAWVEEYAYDKQGWNDADVVHVTEPATTVNADLQPGHTIQGRVTSNGSTGLQSICVSAFPASGTGQPWNGGNTDVNGNYTSPPIPYGTYKIRFSDCNDPPTRVPIWYSQKTSQQAADAVDLSSTNRTGIDAVMQSGYTISGHVTNGSGTALPNVCISLANAYDQSQWPTSWGGQTNQNGDYRTEPVPAGQYKVQFSDCSGSPAYVSEWWNDKTQWSTADVINVSGTTNGINASLATGYTISGAVTAGGTGVAGICVNVNNASQQWMTVAWAQTQADGTYTTSALPPGTYKVQFSDCRTVPQYQTQWYSGAADFNSATPISVTSANVSGKDAALVAGRTVSGKVTSDGTTGIQGICVALGPTTGGPAWYGGRQTQADGTYYTEPVPPGTYTLQFSDCRPSPQYASEWYDNQYNPANATQLDLSTGNLTGKNATLAPGYTISGTVTDGSAGVQGICVQVFNTAWTYPGWQAGGAQTQSGGTYSTPPLPPGNYKIQFNDCRPSPTLISEWWDNVSTYDAATPTTILGSNITGRNATLALGHTISGTITSDGSTPVPNGVAAAYPASGPGPVEGQNPPYFSFADGTGHYRLGPLPSGNYRIQFAQWPTVRYFSEWYNDKPDFASANDVSANTDPSNINAVLESGYTISGHVSNGSGTALQNICVNLSDGTNTDQWIAGNQTDASGDFTVGPVRNGQYVLQFQDCNSPAHYIAEWWNDKTSPETADRITVSGADLTGRDATLATGHTISGKVTSNGTTGIQNICIGVSDASDPDKWFGGGQTDASGNYTTDPLPAGQYKLNFDDCNPSPHYVSEWWNDQPDWDHATPITVTSADLTGHDATLVYGHSITGTVTGQGDGALQDVCVNVVKSTDEGYEVAWGNTDASGQYRTGPLAAGTYKVRFEDCSQSPHWVAEWWNDKAQFAVANTVTIASVDVGSINAELAPGYTMSGHVSETGTGTPLQNVCVDVQRTSDGEYVGGGGTDQNGDYRTEVLPPGDYKASFGACDGPETHVREYWDNKPDFETANVIPLTSGDATGIDAALDPGHRVSGVVTAAGTGTPIANVCVNVFKLSDPDNPVGWGWTDAAGAYDTSALPYGHYKVQFNDCNEATLYVSEWYADKTSFATANDVDLSTANQTINASLARGGGISGTIRSGTGGGPVLGGICVAAHRTDGPGENWSGSDQTGAYRVGGLPSGHYDLDFWDCRDDQSAGIYPPQHLTGIVVTSPNDTTGVDVDMGSPDNTAPETYITSGPIGTTDNTSAVFTFAASEDVDRFSCKLDAGAWADCASPVTFSSLANGAHTLQVAAIDLVGHLDPSAATRTWTVNTSTPLDTHSTRGTVPPGGGTVTDDPLAGGATTSFPIHTAVTSPVAGDVEITEAPAPESPPSGYSFFGYKVSITAPVATAADPLQISFTLDSSLIPAGTPLAAMTVFRDGAPLPACTGVSMADPDPCVLSKTSVAGGDVQFVVLTSHASRWNFGKLDPPANTVLPSISGTPEPGATLTCAAGTWTGSPTSYAYEWRRDGTAIGTGTSHLVVAADAGHDLTCRVTATNAGGSTSATSAAAHVPGPPANTALPAITGTPTVGSTLTCTSGTWTGSPSYAYEWRRDGTAIGTGTTHLVVAADAGHDLSCRVTATNGDGSTSATSAAVHIPGLPTVSSAVSVEEITATSAEIGGTVNPNGAATRYHFDYGLTTAYGLRVPPVDSNVGSDASAHYVGEVVSGLAPATTYHFRLVATNSSGTTVGADHTFTTAAAPPPSDTTPPDVAITCPAPTTAGTAASAHWTASDGGSGLATPASGDVTLDTAAAGEHTAVAPDARDNAGNVRSGVSCRYTVTAQPAAAPVIKIVSTKVTATAKRDVAIKLACSAAPCNGTLSLTAKVKVAGRTKTLKLGSKAFALKADTSATVTIRLSKANFATLKKVKRVTATATAKATGAKTAVTKVVISAPRRTSARAARAN